MLDKKFYSTLGHLFKKYDMAGLQVGALRVFLAEDATGQLVGSREIMWHKGANDVQRTSQLLFQMSLPDNVGRM